MDLKIQFQLEFFFRVGCLRAQFRGLFRIYVRCLKKRTISNLRLPWDVVCGFCDENEVSCDGRYGGRLIFDKILIEDELRLLRSPNDDESFILDAVETGLLYRPEHK